MILFTITLLTFPLYILRPQNTSIPSTLLHLRDIQCRTPYDIGSTPRNLNSKRTWLNGVLHFFIPSTQILDCQLNLNVHCCPGLDKNLLERFQWVRQSTYNAGG
jgi:hypothetical protein